MHKINGNAKQTTFSEELKKSWKFPTLLEIGELPNSCKTLSFCQAQPQLQLSWAELVLFPTFPAAADDGDDTQNSTF